MSKNSLSDAEAFHNNFFYFVESLNTLALGAAKQCEVMGGSNVAWELQHDVLEFGESARNCAGAFLNQLEREEIDRLLADVKCLPPAALSGGEDAMNYPRWAQLRIEAARLIALLAAPIEDNCTFFKK